MMTYLMIVVIFFAICGIIILISDKKEGKFNKVISKHGVSFQDGILTIQSCGSDMGEIIQIHKESDFAIGYKPKELHVGSATVGGVTTGGAYTTGGYHYSTGASSSGKYSLRYMPTAGGVRLTTGEQISKNGEVINSIRLTPDLFAKAQNSPINQYLNELSDSIVVIDNNVKLEAHELLELRMFAYGQGGTSHAVHKAYPTYEKCTAIMNWLTQDMVSDVDNNDTKSCPATYEDTVPVEAESTPKKKKKGIGILLIVIIIIGFIVIPPMKSCSQINADLTSLLQRDVGQSTLDSIINMDKRIANQGFWGNIFISHKDQLEAKRLEAYQFIDATAAELSASIDQLEVYESLETVDQIKEVRRMIRDLYDAFNTKETDYSNKNYYAELQRRTANYADLLTYEEDFEALVSTYMRECKNCGGDGRYSRSCSSCGGAGKKLVTWYSQGDWGTTSYSSYSCTSCGGDGRTMASCSSCTGGYIYDFDAVNQPGKVLYAQGEELLKKEDYEGALEAFSQAAEFSYGDADLRIKETQYRIAETLMDAGNYEEAGEAFAAIEAYDEQSADNPYANAPQMAIYCKTITAVETLEQYADAAASFRTLGDLKDSRQLADYYLARSYEEAASSLSVIAEASDEELVSAKTGYQQAFDIYEELSFKDSSERKAVCQQQIDVIEAEQSERETAAVYQKAVALENEKKYTEAIELYQSLGSYKDSADRAAACQVKHTYDKALALEAAHAYEEALETFNELDGYEDSAEHIAICEEAILEEKYQLAKTHWLAHEYEHAMVLYEDLGDYKDSKDQLRLAEDALTPCAGIGTMYNQRILVKRSTQYLNDYNYGYNDENGNPVIPCQYSDAGAFTDIYAPVKKGSRYGYIDVNGNTAIPFSYDHAYNFSDGLAHVSKNNKHGFINLNGNTVVPFEYDEAWTFSNGFACVKKNNRWGYVDTTGTLVVDCIYEEVSNFSEGYGLVKMNNRWGAINTTGTLVVPCEYERIYSFYEDLAIVRLDRKFGYVNTAGELVIPCEYDNSDYFIDGLAAVQKDDQWFFINATNTVVMTCEFDMVLSFRDGVSIVKSNGKYGFMDRTGELIVPCVYDNMTKSTEGMVWVCQNEKWGCVDISGKQLIPCEYEVITYHDGYFALVKNKIATVISREELQPGYKEMLLQMEQEREASRIAREQERTAQQYAQKMLTVYSDKDTIKSVQAALNNAGYDCGTPDGIAGKGTTAAVTQYQTDMGLNVTGTITHELLISLISLGLIES